jgi:CRP-like cAMP-binding protein
MNARAIKPTRLRCLPVEALRRSSDPLIGFRLYEVLAGELAATRDLVLSIGRRGAVERVAAFLLAFSRRNEENQQSRRCFDLPITRTDIGDFLGLSIETVSRAFTELKKRGLIELPRANHVKLVDIEGLRRRADGVQKVLRAAPTSQGSLAYRMARFG